MNERKLSIAALLSVALVAVITLLLAVFAALFYAAERTERETQLTHTLAVAADQQAAALALPMWNLDASHVVAILRSGLRERALFAVATTIDGKLLVQQRDAAWGAAPAAHEPDPAGLLVQQRNIEHRGEVLGQVRVYATPRFLEEGLAAQRRSIVAGIFALDAALVLSLYLLLSRLLLKPVQAIDRFAAAVQGGERPDAEPRGILFFGELKALNASIRGMTDMLDARYRALRSSEERLKLATRAANIGVWDWDVQRNELVWNDEMYSLYGIRKEDFGGAYEAWMSAVAPEHFRQTQEDVRAALRGEREFVSQFSVVRPDGSTCIIKGEAATIRDETGRACRMVGVNIDITDSKRAEEQIHRLNAELEHRVHERTAQLQAANADLARARDVAESATRAKSEFLANMSHEIRTPMNAILGMTELALRSELGAKQRGYLGKAKVAANSLLLIINDILDFSKIEAGKLDMEATEFRLQGVLDRVTTVVALKAQEKGLELLLNTAADVPPVLIGDPLRLEQVLINLCSNAVKFTADGEIVVVTVKSVVAEDDSVMLRFSVRDTGVGMSARQIEGLFQPFNQLDASTTRRHGGTGLGLAICRKLVTLMGGEIGVRSQPGKGSDFHFTARFGRVRQEALPPATQALPRGLRVLVIDDSANSREILQSLLQGLGCRPALAGSGADGLVELARAASADTPYDLVLIDWKMPQMDGFELAGQLRGQPGLRPRTILVTAYGDEAVLRRAVAEGFDGSLTKPVSAAALGEAIAGALAGGGESGGAAAPRTDDAAPQVLRGRHVLLVEDNEFNQIVAAELLRDVAGMAVSVAANGHEALQRVRGEHFDAVLMDVQMPVMDGYQATALIRQETSLQALPIIAMTAHAMPGDREKCLAVGMNDHVSKPFDPSDLFATLARWIAGEDVDVPPARPPVQPGVSFELGLRRCMGRVELYERILGRFLATRMADPADIRDALARHEPARAALIAHSLISTAGTLGAEGLSEASRALQLAIDAGAFDRLPALLDDFTERHAAAAEAVRRYFETARAGLKLPR